MLASRTQEILNRILKENLENPKKSVETKPNKHIEPQKPYSPLFVDYDPEDLVIPENEVEKRIDLKIGSLDGDQYFTFFQVYTDNRKFTQTAYNRKYRYLGDVNKLKFLIDKVMGNIDTIEYAKLVDKRFQINSSRHLLLEVQGGKIIAPNAIMVDWHHKKYIKLDAVFQRIQNQYKR